LTDPAGRTDLPGWYVYRPVAALAEWDGTAWTGRTHDTAAGPELPGPPPPFAFLRQAWPWWMLVGQLLVIVPGIVSGYTGSGYWSWTSVVGYTAFMVGTVEVVVRYLPIRRLDRLRGLTVIGIGCGLVGFAIAFGLETFTVHAFGDVTTLWLTGPIEEGGKLLVPFLLLAFGSARFKDPLVGLYLVLVSGATTGAVEGTEWQARAHHPWYHLQLALIRPAAELPHVFVTGFAGAVIWLAAWRSHRAVTGAGTVAFLIAVGIHSLHDGFITLFGVAPQPSPSSIARSIGQAFATGTAGAFFATGIGIATFLLGRHAIRELTTPAAVTICPPPWRPRIKPWGRTHVVRAEIREHSAHPVAPVGIPPLVAPVGAAPSAPAQAPMPVPHLAPSVPPPLLRPYAPPLTPLRALPPPPAPAGWYRVDNDPYRLGWWDGTTWAHPLRWDGTSWRPG
jgi:hypothetical protein